MRQIATSMKSCFVTLVCLLCCSIHTCIGTHLPFTDKERGDIVQKFISGMNETGYNVGVGSMFNFMTRDCVVLLLPGGTGDQGCYGNNPASPYGLYTLPTIEGEWIDDDINEGRMGTNHSKQLGEHRIRGDEAIIFLGKTPPKSAYYGYTHYLKRRKLNDGGNVTIFGSLSDSLNPTNLKLARSMHGSFEDSFDKDVVIIATPHRDVYSAVEDALKKAGVSSNIMNLQAISPELFRWGLGKEADTLSFLNRVAFIENDESADDYLNDPKSIIFRVTPRVEKNVTDPYVKPTRAPRTMVTNEHYLEHTLNKLEDAVLKTYSPNIIHAADVKDFPLVGQSCMFGERCIMNEKPCYADNGDATYFASYPEQTITDNQFYVIIGVDHMRSSTGAKYSSVVVGSTIKNLGIEGFNSIEHMESSSSVYLDVLHEHRDSVYAMTVRRDCTDHDFCLEIGNGLLGLPDEEPPNFLFRTYLHKHGSVGAPVDSLLMDRLFFVDPDSNRTSAISKGDKLAHKSIRDKFHLRNSAIKL